MMQVLEVREFEKIIEANEKNQNLKGLIRNTNALIKRHFMIFLNLFMSLSKKKKTQTS